MAVDTVAKRFSIMGMQGCGQGPLLPQADGVIGKGDRYHLLDLFTGDYPVSPEDLTLLPLLGVGF